MEGFRGMSEMTSGSAPAQKAASEKNIPTAASNEKREHPRFKVEGASAVVGNAGFLGGLLGARKHRLVNLSQGGAMIQVNKRLPVGSKHDLRLEIPKYKEVIKAVGEVRWCLESAKNSDVYMGVRFVDLDAGERRKIAGMCELVNSLEYKAKSVVRKDNSSIRLQAPKK
jgi:hypothetical protein